LVDARQYLKRIGAERPRRPTPEALSELHFVHLSVIPFENLDIHLGVPIVLEPDRILEKIVARGRGGFCYELNYAFHWLLTELGYRVSLLSAEVARPGGGFGIPFDHMALLVDAGSERWLADVGFGDSFLRPLRLLEGELHEESEHTYRLTRGAEYWKLGRRSRSGGGYEAQYRFTTAPRRLDDFRSGCEYHQTSPQSTFTQKVVATRALEDGRVTVTRDRVILRQGEMRTETPIPSESSFRRALAEHLGIALETP
jgi:N-hydroxyarylamine O-acetyltransferase